MGDNPDITRNTNPAYGTLLPDTPGLSYGNIFGSAHLDGFQMALCDGSVRLIRLFDRPRDAVAAWATAAMAW